MWKKALALSVYVLLLLFSVSAAWILQTKQNTGNFAELFYGADSGNRLSVAAKDITMDVIFLMSDKWQNIGSSDGPVRTTPIVLSQDVIVPHSSAPFRIRFSSTSSEVRTVRLSLEVKCDKRLIDKQAIFVAASAGQNYTRYTGQVTIPSQVYIPLYTDGSYTVDPLTGFVTFKCTLYESLEIPPATQGYPVEVSCYFYFDKERMDNECAGCHFEILSFEAG